jgi:hypothetical protein
MFQLVAALLLLLLVVVVVVPFGGFSSVTVVDGFVVQHSITHNGRNCPPISSKTPGRVDLVVLASPKDGPSSSSSSSLVSVWDNVFSVDRCDELHDLACDHADRGMEGASIFDRRLASNSTSTTTITTIMTPLEHALHSILTAMGDTNPIVEYWSRQDYINMDAHSDIDEVVLEEEGDLRYPAFGHVLYLTTRDDGTVAGPTCVFPTQLGGWQDSSATTTFTTSSIPLVTIPTVPGRVLRFPGAAMHAVPKPCHRWLLSKKEQIKLRRQEEEDEEEAAAFKENEQEEEEELIRGMDYNPDNYNPDDDDYSDEENVDFDDSDDNDEDSEERSVILFNTWSDQGPRGLTRDYMSGSLPDGIAVEEDEEDDDENDESSISWQEQQRAEWEADYGVDCESLWCNAMSEWKPVDLIVVTEESSSTSGNDSTIPVTVSLMGKKKRRLHPKKYIPLQAPPQLQAGLEHDKQPMLFQLSVK